MSEQRNQGWFEIKEALRLDSCEQDERAFTKYLEGVQKLCTYIRDETNLQELQRNESARVGILKILSTMKKSLTRVEEIIAKPDPLNPKQANGICERSFSSGINSVQPASKVTTNNSRLLDIAQKQNIKLWKTYQNRCQNTKDPAQKVTLSLELQRRMQENLAVARERTSKYRQEQSKKEAEALHLAASKLANSCVPNEIEADRHGWSNKVALCACVLHYKPEDNWIQSFLKQFRENQSQALIISAVRRLLRTPNHPLTTWLYGKQTNLKDRLSSILSQQLTRDTRMAEFLKGQVNNSDGTDLLSMFDPVQNVNVDTLEPLSAVKDVAQETSSILETFLQIFGVSLELSDCSDYVDGCYLTLEQDFFHALWPVIIKLYRHIYKEEEATLTTVCQKFKSGTDTDVNISDLLSLPAQKLDAIFVVLQKFLSEYSPLAKVQSLVEITHILCENDTTLKYEKVLSADDLIGLVSCLLVQSNVPHLFAEFEALEQFTPHRFLLGEEGYSLTTFLTAVRYLESQGETWKQSSSVST